MTFQASNYRKGGISHICFSNDAQAIKSIRCNRDFQINEWITEIC